MLKIITEKGKLQATQRQFEKIMLKQSEEKGIKTIGGKGFNFEAEIRWSNSLELWWASYLADNDKTHKERYENAFGLVKPNWEKKYGLGIPSVIDIPIEGIDRRIGGAFAEDGNKHVYIIHRGKIGGGKIGIGKKLFFENYQGEWQEVQDGEQVSRVALVADFASDKLPEQIAFFVREVQRIKSQANVPSPITNLPLVFNEEFSGNKAYETTKVEADCNHGLVVSLLRNKLQELGINAYNKFPMDLFVINQHQQLTRLFEIKTDATTTSCYTAVGQLLFYSAKFTNTPKLIAVFPDSLDSKTKETLSSLGIKVLTYNWVNKKPNFDSGFIRSVIKK